MSRTHPVSRVHLVPTAASKRLPSTRRRVASSPSTPALSTRRVQPDDLPWLESWSASLGLPTTSSRAIQGYVLLKDDQRVGYLATRDQIVETARGREPVRWIVSAFLVPSLRGHGLLMRFGEILSRQVYPQGKLGARIAAHNTRMLKLMRVGGWTKIGSTRNYTDFMLELRAPFRAAPGARKG